MKTIEDRYYDLIAEVPLCRNKFSSESRAEFREARDAGDLQKQLDIIYDVLTGVELAPLPEENNEEPE